MQNSTISSKQAIYMMILFFIGSSAVTGVSTSAKQDSWISFIITIVITIPLVLIYSRIIKLFPEKNLYDIVYYLFGKIGGFILSIIYIFYSFQLGALVIRNFTEFIQIISLTSTPQIILAIFFITICLWLSKNGLNIMGRISIVFLPLIILFVILTIVLLIKNMDLNNLKPILDHDFNTIFGGSIAALSFPYAESVLFLVVLSSLHKKDSPYKVYISGVLISGLILLLALLRNILTIGIPTLELLYFPSYAVASIVSVNDFITRIEILISTNFLLAGIIKVSVCLFASAKGVAKVLKIDNYKLILSPIAFLMISFSLFMYSNTMQMFDFISIYPYYAALFQTVLPITILIFAEFKVWKNKKITHNIDE